MLVYVENIDKQPLMHTSPAKARILLKTGRAKVVHTTPFTIRLTYVVANHVQPLTHGVDTGIQLRIIKRTCLLYLSRRLYAATHVAPTSEYLSTPDSSEQGSGEGWG
ncbi:MAG TPA: RRXRR domain-containing protein, partial [Terracidiphilus sp.]